MSNILLSNDGGNSIYTIESPNTNTNRTLTLPDADCSIGNAETMGKIINVWQVNKVDTWSTSGYTYADITGLSLTVTPESPQSKFVIHVFVRASSNHWKTYLRVLRNGNTMNLGDYTAGKSHPNAVHAYTKDDANAHGVTGAHRILIHDEPKTSSSVTYKLQGAGRNEGGTWTMYVNRSVPDRTATEYDPRYASRMIIMEYDGKDAEFSQTERRS